MYYVGLVDPQFKLLYEKLTTKLLKYMNSEHWKIFTFLYKH